MALWGDDRGLQLVCACEPGGTRWASGFRPCFPLSCMPSLPGRRLSVSTSGIATNPCQPEGATGRLGAPL